jgi:glucose/arabinose dehydrogenase
MPDNVSLCFLMHAITSGGSITIGTDRNVYITLGDKDRRNLVQDNKSYAGSIIRVTQSGGVPSDNWGNQASGRKPEVWARGLRNGFRSTWDYQTNKFYIFEVGGNNHDTAQVRCFI